MADPAMANASTATQQKKMSTEKKKKKKKKQKGKEEKTPESAAVVAAKAKDDGGPASTPSIRTDAQKAAMKSEGMIMRRAKKPSDLSSKNDTEEEEKPLAKVFDFLYFGNLKMASDLELLRASNVRRIINLSCMDDKFPDEPDFEYLRIDAFDVPTYDIAQHFDECNKFIEEGRQQDQVTFVHCQQGMSRSATVCVSYALRHRQPEWTLRDAYTHCRKARGIILPNDGFVNALCQLEVDLRGGEPTMDRRPTFGFMIKK